MRRILIIAGLFCASWVGATDYYTSPSATGGGTGTYASPFTLQEAADTAVGGETIYVLAGTYALATTANVDWDTNLGTVDSPIRVTGRSVTSTATEALATIDGNGLSAGQNIFDVTVAALIVFDNLRLTGAPLYGVNVTGAAGLSWRLCRIDDAGSHGYYSIATTGRNSFYKCEFDSNGGSGLDVNTTGRGRYLISYCAIHDNVGHGVRDGGASTSLHTAQTGVDHTLIYDNGGSGIVVIALANYPGPRITNCTIVGNTSDGINIDADNGIAKITHNIIALNGGYGINFNGDADTCAWLSNICSYLNTSGHTDVTSGTLPGPGSGHVLADPQLVSVVDGIEDLTPQNAALSVAWAFPAGGSDYSYIGAIQPECTGVAGGGGPLVGPGRLAR